MTSATNCTGGEFGWYALIGHPELSTGADLMVSYFDPVGLAHLHLAAFPWSKPMGRSTGEVAAGGCAPVDRAVKPLSVERYPVAGRSRPPSWPPTMPAGR